MPSGYDISQFLLDKADIEEIVYRWLNACDMSQWEKLATDVFKADKNIIDYTDIFAPKVMEMTGQEVSELWKPRLAGLDATQHVTSGTLINLPRPGSNVKPPGKVTATAETIATFRLDKAKGDRLFQDGSRYFMELERVSHDPSAGNCWRICAVKATSVWNQGNIGIMMGH